MTAAIQPYRSTPPAAFVRMAGANVACELQLVGVDRRYALAAYDVVLTNASPYGVTCRVYGIERNGAPAEHGIIDIPAGGYASSRLAVPLRRRRTGLVYVEVVGSAVHLRAESRSPQLDSAPGWRRIALALVPLAGVAAAVWMWAVPSVTALATPRTATPGTVTANYAVRGTGRTTYRALASDGTILATADLPAAAGTFDVPIPARVAGSRIVLSLDTTSPLGRAERNATIDVVPASVAPREPMARIAALSVKRVRTGLRSAIVAAYRADADRGEVRVLDVHGAVLGTAPYAATGSTRIPLVRDPRGEPLRTELVVYRGASRAAAAVELASAIVPALPVVRAEPSNGAPFVVSGPAVSGMPFRVQIRELLPQMRLELQDEIGTTLDEKAVSPGQGELTFIAPATRVFETFYVVCTYMRAGSEETTIVSPLRVAPR
jgi:hypothetical protein